MDLGEVDAEVQVIVAVLEDGHVDTELMAGGAHLAGVGHLRSVAARIRNRNREYLVGHVLVGECIFEAYAVLEQTEIGTHFHIFGILGLQVGVIHRA